MIPRERAAEMTVVPVSPAPVVSIPAPVTINVPLTLGTSRASGGAAKVAIEQGASRDIKGVLGPVHHHDLVRFTAHRASGSQVGSESLAERLMQKSTFFQSETF